MHTHEGTLWVAVPTELDELWCPHLEFAAGHAEGRVALLFEGGSKPSKPTFEGERFYLLEFSQVQMVAGYAEGMYHVLAEETPGSGCTISEIMNSRLIRDLSYQRAVYRHFFISSGGMHCEVAAAPEFRIRRFASREAALHAARGGAGPRAENVDAQEDGFDFEAAVAAAKERAES